MCFKVQLNSEGDTCVKKLNGKKCITWGMWPLSKQKMITCNILWTTTLTKNNNENYVIKAKSKDF